MYESETTEALFGRAEECRIAMDLREALRLYEEAERAGYDPNQCGAARWTCYMLLGECEQAWVESDRIERRGWPDPHRFWEGQDWAGQDVLIRCLHGLGDTLQFIRFAPLVRSRARSVTIEAQPKLKELLASSNLADRVMTWGEPEGEWQVQMEVNELPRVFRFTEGAIPWSGPYLQVAKADGVTPGAEIVEGDAPVTTRIGLVWTASSFDPSRNVPLPALAPLLQLPGFSFISLQAGEGWTEEMPAGLRGVSQVNTPIAEIAAEMLELDLVITVDTMNAHLAGALGRPTWTLLPHQCDWRWMAGRKDTPWYPTMRLFRQPTAGDWRPVMAELRESLLSLRTAPVLTLAK